MQTNEGSLTPLRIQNGDCEASKSALVVAAVVCGPILVLLIIWDLFAKGMPPSEVLASLPGRAFFIVLIVGGLIAFIYFVNGGGIPGSLARPYWVEISDQLSYQNRRGLTHVDWVDVKSMHFAYSHIYESDDPLPHDAYSTYLIVTLARGRRLHIQVESVVPSAADCIDTIIQTLARGFSANQSKTRQGAVTGLSRLSPVCLNNLRDVAKHGEHDCLREDATEAIKKLQSAVPLLQTVAANDDDESVRMVAAKAVEGFLEGCPTSS